MICSFANKETETFFFEGRSRRFSGFATIARRKLQVLEDAGQLDDLREPYGNHLEALKGDRKGQHSVRINKQYRICFRWRDGHAFDVEIVDYH